MFVELITTGTELLLGATLNSHQQWLGRRLAELGLPVSRQLTVPDTGTAIAEAVGEALQRADLVITTGGLGPTADDRTRDEIARLLGVELERDLGIESQIQRYFERRNRPLPLNSFVQAKVPRGARVLVNEHGSAPGLAIEVPAAQAGGSRGVRLIMLPGPPRELRPMFETGVTPLLKEAFPAAGGFVCLTLHTIGIGESRVEEAIHPHLIDLEQRGLEIGYCARIGEVDVRLSAAGAEAGTVVGEAVRLVRRLLGKFIYSADDRTLEELVIEKLRAAGQRLITAESCTGGRLADELTNVPGASDVFVGGLVTYSNALKESLLGVRGETLAKYGAVSEETASEMALGARQRHGVDWAIAISGIAGPAGGTVEKPVGTVFIALADAERVEVRRQFNAFDRETFKEVTARQSLDWLRQRLAAAGDQK